MGTRKAGHLFSCVAAILLMAAAPLGTATAVPLATYFDGTFNDSDWTRYAEVTRGTPVYQETAEQSLTGGNPDAYRYMTHTWGNGTRVVVRHFNINAMYDPSVSGAIGYIDYSADVIGLGGVDGVFGDAFLIEQDNRLFMAAITAVPITTSGWLDKDYFNLTADNFRAVDGGVGPDFSALGSAITFGYARSNTLLGGVSTVAHGIDNWSVTIHDAPEPGMLALLGLGITLIGFRQRKNMTCKN